MLRFCSCCLEFVEGDDCFTLDWSIPDPTSFFEILNSFIFGILCWLKCSFDIFISDYHQPYDSTKHLVRMGGGGGGNSHMLGYRMLYF